MLDIYIHFMLVYYKFIYLLSFDKNFNISNENFKIFTHKKALYLCVSYKNNCHSSIRWEVVVLCHNRNIITNVQKHVSYCARFDELNVFGGSKNNRDYNLFLPYHLYIGYNGFFSGRIFYI